MTDALHPALSPEHLTDVLRRAGALTDGHVSRIVVESSRDKLLSQITRARLAYEGGTHGAPEGLLLKTALRGGVIDMSDAGRKEVEFYNVVAAATPPGLLPRCFEAVWEPDAKTWHLLLEDLTDSHLVVTDWPVPPTSHARQRRRARLEPSLSSRRRQHRRTTHRLECLAHRHRHGRSRLHDGGALVPGAPAAAGIATPRPLPRRTRRPRRHRLRPRGPRR